MRGLFIGDPLKICPFQLYTKLYAAGKELQSLRKLFNDQRMEKVNSASKTVHLPKGVNIVPSQVWEKRTDYRVKEGIKNIEVKPKTL